MKVHAIARKLVSACLLLVMLSLSWQAQAKGIFYRFEKDDGKTHYLLGTMHSGDPRVMKLLEISDASLSGSNRLVLEMVPDLAAIAASAGAMLLPEGQKLQDVIGDELWLRLVTALGERGAQDAVALQRLKPWALAMTLSLPPGQTDDFLDKSLYLKALEKQKPVYGLETAAEQLAIFDGLSLEDQKSLLLDALDQQAALPQLFEGMVSAYQSADLDRLSQLIKEYEGSTDPRMNAWFEDRLIRQRNQLMSERLKPLLAEGACFIAVGALHLIGESGLMAELKRQGYTLTPIY